MGQWGAYDYQRSGPTFISAYTNASNFGVGVYMNGAGFSLDQTMAIANSFAYTMSKNAGSKKMKGWWINGWNAANSGKLNCECQKK